MARILDIKYYVPSEKITNEYLSEKFKKWTPDGIFEKTGIRLRGKAGGNTTAGDLAIFASKKLLKDSDIKKSLIDVLIFITQTPNQCAPSTSCEIHASLGLKQECGAFDVNQGCAGYIYGLNLASSLIDSGSANYVLLLTGDTYTKIINENDPSVAPIFGDGASASLIGPDLKGCSKKSIGRFEFGTDGTKTEFLNCDFGGFRKKQTDWKDLYMNGAGVMVFTLDTIPKAINNYLKNENFKNEDIDLVILHQANKFILDRIHEKTNLKDKGVICLNEFGNTVSSSIPIALANNVDLKCKRNMKILLAGFGVGLSWGITLIRL